MTTIKNLKDLRMALRNAQFETQKRLDVAGVRYDTDDSPVFDRSRRRRRRDSAEQDIRNILRGEDDD